MSGARADRVAAFLRFPASRAAAAPTSVGPQVLDHVFVTDELCFSLIATVARWGGAQADRLFDADRLAEWLEMVELPPLTLPASPGQLTQLAELRLAVHAVVSARLAGTPPEAGAVAVVNLAADAKPAVVLLADDLGPRPGATITFPELLATLAQSCVAALTGPWSGRIRRCERTPCSHVFIDRSARGQRRWCTSESCGNIARARRHREKVAAAGDAAGAAAGDPTAGAPAAGDDAA